LAGETEILGENLPQYQFVHHKPHMTRAAAVESLVSVLVHYKSNWCLVLKVEYYNIDENPQPQASRNSSVGHEGWVFT
jgi:hypothetical protein